MFAIDNHPRARMTIEVLGLNREALAEMRLDHLEPFRLLLRALPLLPPDSEDVLHPADEEPGAFIGFREEMALGQPEIARLLQGIGVVLPNAALRAVVLDVTVSDVADLGFAERALAALRFDQGVLD